MSTGYHSFGGGDYIFADDPSTRDMLGLASPGLVLARPPPSKLKVDEEMVDPFEEAVFPDPRQTPPRVKPKPNPQQMQQVVPASSVPPVAEQAAAAITKHLKPSTKQPQMPAASPGNGARKSCAHASCTNDRFARGYCAYHLSELAAVGGDNAPVGAVAPTPTTRIRNVHNLWSKNIHIDREAFKNECTWRLIHQDDAHTIVIRDNTFIGLRTVHINNKEVFRGAPEMGSWKLDATIGKTFKTSLNVKVLVLPTAKGYEYECLIDDLKFDDAHAAFLAKLSASTLIQRVGEGEKRFGTKGAAEVRAQQLRDVLYVKQNWTMLTDEEKTVVGGVKSRITWAFTVKGQKHTCLLEYGSLSGKKKVVLDGQVICEEKPPVLSANKHKRWAHCFMVDGVQCRVTSGKNKKNVPDPRRPHERPPPFLFDFFIGGVPFEQCIQTETDRAGGDITLEEEAAAQLERLRLQAKNGRPTATGRRNSVHAPLTSAEYEQALAEENERERRAEEERKRQQQAKAQKKHQQAAASSSSDDSDSSSDDSSDEE